MASIPLSEAAPTETQPDAAAGVRVLPAEQAALRPSASATCCCGARRSASWPGC